MLYDERWGKKAKSTKSKLQSWQVTLLLAADELETNGWCQRDFSNGLGSHCAIGAIHEVGKRNRKLEGADIYDAMAKLENALQLPIAAWNDHPYRTKKEVVAKLREVANAV